MTTQAETRLAAGSRPEVTEHYRYSREEIEAAGYLSVADFLRALPVNSFGSWREQSGNTAQGQAVLNLRGLGSNRTVLLLNGDRLPGSPVADAQIQNLNTLPFAAVDYIEVLPAGASAIHGSGAIGGVVNIVLRKDIDKAEVSVRASSPDRPGGAERGVSLVDGITRQDISLSYGIEADERDIILMRDRYFTRNRQIGSSPYDFSSYSDLSFFGRNVIDLSGGTYIAYPMISGVEIADATPNAAGAVGGNEDMFSGEPLCALYGDAFWSQVLEDSRYPGDYLCAYDYTRIAATTTTLERVSAFMDGEYAMTDDLLFTVGLFVGRSTSRDRFAPTPSSFTWSGPALPTEEITYGGETYTLNPIDPGDEIHYRWNAIAPARVSEQVDDQYRLHFGFQGRMGAMDWQARYVHDRYELDETGTGHINDLAVQDISLLGWDPRHPDQAQYSNLLREVAARTSRRAWNDVQRVELEAKLPGPELPGGDAVFSLGGEYVDQEYVDEIGDLEESGNISGSAGGNTAGRRSHWAVHAEADFPLHERFFLRPALRYDSFNDVGSVVSSRLGAGFRVMDSLQLHASASRDFRAPSLGSMYERDSVSYSHAVDIEDCGATGFSVVYCPQQQYATQISGNPGLGIEQSTEYRIGADWMPFRGEINTFRAGVDYYQVEITDVHEAISTQDAFYLEIYNRLDEFPGVDVIRDNAGRHSLTHTTWTSLPEMSMRGIDINTHAAFSLGGKGDIAIDFQWSRLLEYRYPDLLVGPAVDISGRPNRPDWRSALDINWSLGRHALTLSSRFIAAQAGRVTYSSGFTLQDMSTLHYVSAASDAISEYEHHNLVYSYKAAWDGVAGIGILNVTDENPPLAPNGDFRASLYPLTSRALYFSYTQRF